MPARSSGKAKRPKVAEDQPVFNWLVLGEDENERRFAIKPGGIDTFLLGQLSASHTLAEMYAAQYTLLQNVVVEDDWLSLHAFLASGQDTMEHAIDVLFKAFSERPTARSEPSSDGSGLGPETTKVSTADPVSDASSDDSDSPASPEQEAAAS